MSALRVERYVLVAVPQVLGDSPSDAEAALRAAGLIPEPHSTDNALSSLFPLPAQVCSVSPQPGTKVSPGSTVTLSTAKVCGLASITVPGSVGGARRAPGAVGTVGGARHEPGTAGGCRWPRPRPRSRRRPRSRPRTKWRGPTGAGQASRLRSAARTGRRPGRRRRRLSLGRFRLRTGIATVAAP